MGDLRRPAWPVIFVFHAKEATLALLTGVTPSLPLRWTHGRLELHQKSIIARGFATCVSGVSGVLHLRRRR